jgi:hypothetical protein
MAKYLRITRPDEYPNQSYMMPVKDADIIIEGEFCDAQIGEKITLELVELDEEEYNKAPEFMGW